MYLAHFSMLVGSIVCKYGQSGWGDVQKCVLSWHFYGTSASVSPLFADMCPLLHAGRTHSNITTLAGVKALKPDVSKTHHIWVKLLVTFLAFHLEQQLGEKSIKRKNREINSADCASEISGRNEEGRPWLWYTFPWVPRRPRLSKASLK